jgi:HAE1 family hydrophobic/amphiphilic exporter-1
VLGDVAAVSLETVRDASFFRLDGREGTLVRVFRAPEANAVALAARVRERAGELARRATAGLRVEVVEDRSAEVVAALREMGLATLLGLGLGIAVLRLLLGRWRPTLALAVVVPASMLATFSAFHLCGVPLDVVSLAGLALAAGMLVDSSIVVLEAIETARAQRQSEPETLEVTGTRQIAKPVIAGFLTTAVVLLPLLYLQGLARAFFGAQAFAIVASLAASLLFSLTVTPVLARDARERRQGPPAGRTPGRALYLRLLDRSLARPALPVAAALAATAAAVLAALFLPHELVPAAATRELVVRYRLAPDLAPEAARRRGEAVEARAAEALRGSRAERLAVQPAAAGTSPGSAEESGRITLRFPDMAGASRAQRVLRDALSRLPGVEVWVAPRPSAFAAAIEKAGRRLEVVASAATPERAEALARRAAGRLRGAGLREATLRRERGREALLLTWDVPRLAALGADRDRLEEQVREALADQESGRVRILGTQPEIVVFPTSQENPALLPIAVAANDAGKAGVYPLGALARLRVGARPPALEREGGLPAVRLAFESGGKEGKEGDAGDPEALLRGVARAVGEEVSPGGQALELRRAFGQLRLALALSLLLVFLVVAALYESLRTPLVVMTTVPVALGGALALLALGGQTLNILSFLGLILLAGIVVNNAIVLVHRIEDHLRAGSPLDAAVRRAGEERYRPILMTTLATVAGMLPLALLGGAGVELRRSLALAVIGGMSLSTFASLLLVPVLYRFAHRDRGRQPRQPRPSRP